MNTIPLENGFRYPPDRLSKMERLELVKKNPVAMSMICQRIAEGESLKSIADGEMVPYGQLQMWIAGDPARMELYRNAERILADSLIHEAIARSDDVVYREKDGKPVMDAQGQPVIKDVAWARLQVTTRLKAAQMFDSERFVQAAKTETPPLSDDGIAAVAKHLAGAFSKRNLPGSTAHIPQDIESETVQGDG